MSSDMVVENCIYSIFYLTENWAYEKSATQQGIRDIQLQKEYNTGGFGHESGLGGSVSSAACRIVVVEHVVQVPSSALTTSLVATVKIPFATSIATNTAKVLLEDLGGRPVILKSSEIRVTLASLIQLQSVRWKR